MFVCRFGVERSVDILPSLVKETFTSRKGMLEEECELMNLMVDGFVVKIVDENF